MDSNRSTTEPISGADAPLLTTPAPTFVASAAGATSISGGADIPPSDPPDYMPVTTEPPEQEGGDKKVIVIAVAVVLALLACIGGSTYVLLQPTTDTARVRDIFIIFMALETLVMGVALVVLIVQLARLLNLLQNEIKPILDSTNETVSHLRGTTMFLSENLVEPVIKLNEYMAGFSQLVQLLGLTRKPKRK
jgi:hypothetical protein